MLISLNTITSQCGGKCLALYGIAIPRNAKRVAIKRNWATQWLPEWEFICDASTQAVAVYYGSPGTLSIL
jgi:hypothetical protein